jgi:hypothetical protein
VFQSQKSHSYFVQESQPIQEKSTFKGQTPAIGVALISIFGRLLPALI